MHRFNRLTTDNSRVWQAKILFIRNQQRLYTVFMWWYTIIFMSSNDGAVPLVSCLHTMQLFTVYRVPSTAHALSSRVHQLRSVLAACFSHFFIIMYDCQHLREFNNARYFGHSSPTIDSIVFWTVSSCRTMTWRLVRRQLLRQHSAFRWLPFSSWSSSGTLFWSPLHSGFARRLR